MLQPLSAAVSILVLAAASVDCTSGIRGQGQSYAAAQTETRNVSQEL